MTASVEHLAALARTLHSQPTSQETLDHAVRAALDLISGCDSAGISVSRRDQRLRTAATTGPVPARSVEIQRDLGEGPCLEVGTDDSVLHLRDLATETRWTGWATQVHAELGVASVMCVPLSTHEGRLEVLSLYSPSARAFDTSDEMVALTLAAQAAVALASAEQVEQLGDALSSRTIIGKAVGLTMHRYRLTGEQAFDVLRRHSNERNRKLVDLAREMVEDWDSSQR